MCVQVLSEFELVSACTDMRKLPIKDREKNIRSVELFPLVLQSTAEVKQILLYLFNTMSTHIVNICTKFH